MPGWVIYELVSFVLNVGFGVFIFRYIRSYMEAEPAYFAVDVEGVERWFCELCGKEEGACARCEEVVV